MSFWSRLVCGFLTLLMADQAVSADLAADHEVESSDLPIMAIIIDDLGNSLDNDLRAVQLPGIVTCSVLPRTPFGRELAIRAHEVGKQVMLHLPLQAESGGQPDAGGIELDTDRQTAYRIVIDDLDWLPYVEGVNNPRGSLLTRHPGHMKWLMDVLASRGLFFVDSRTTPFTVALQVAREQAVSATRRDIFLDHVLTDAAIRTALDQAIKIAKRKGSVVAIAHPHALTLRILEQLIPTLAGKGVRLGSVAQIIHYRDGGEPVNLAATQTVSGGTRAGNPRSAVNP